MNDDWKVLDRAVNDRKIHRRHHKKTDGRDLFLFGFTKHEARRLPGDDLESIQGSELRHHPLRGDWSIYAAGRIDRL